jgi:hypothetical protein
MTDILEKAKQYQMYGNKKCNAHYKAAEITSASNRRLGIAVIISTTFVGTSIFAELGKDDTYITILLGLLSFLAAALATTQTFLKYAETAEAHRIAAAGYEGLRSVLDLFILRYSNSENLDRELALSEFEKITLKFREIADKSPSISDKIYDSIKVE